jgi:hypothetical protein
MRFSKTRDWGLLLGALLVLQMAGTASAVTFLDTQYGTPRAAALPRSLALGGTGVSWLQGSQAVVNNPAALAMYQSRFGVDVGLGFWHVGEDRSVPLYDSFESFVRENTYALNRNTYGDIQGGVLWRVYDEIPMTLAVGIYDRFDFDYDYFEEIRDPSGFEPIRDRIIRTHDWNVDGRIRSVSAGYGSQVWGPTHLGVSVHRYFGSMTNTRRVTPVLNPSDGVQQESLERDFEGWGYSVGGHGAPTEHIDLAVSWEGEFLVRGTTTITTFDVSDTTTVASEEWVRYPGTLTFGVTYRPRSILRTTFSAEAVRRFWENLDDSVVDKAVSAGATRPHLRDTWDLRLGLEHIFYNQMPLRFGFRFVENYADPASDRSIFSAGIGYTFADWQVDVTGQYGRQTSRQQFLFDRSVLGTDGGPFVPPDSDTRVDDSVVSLIVGVSRGF